MEQGKTSDALYTIQAIPGKGLGLVAATDIKRGTRILCEAPVVRIPGMRSNINQKQAKKRAVESLKKQVASLSAKDREAFYSLHMHDRGEKSKELVIAKTNGLPLGSGAAEGGIFLEASRINHSCLANSQNSWNENLNKLTIHASRDIPKGEEITIQYSEDYVVREDRQHHLRQTFGFICGCALCSLPPKEQEASDRRLEEIKRLNASVAEKAMSAPAQAMREVERVVELLQEEGIADGRVSSAWYDAFQVALFTGDLARAKVFCERAHAYRVVVEGHDCPEAQRLSGLCRDPSKHIVYQLCGRRSSGPQMIPDKRDEGLFEAWLWKREPQSINNPTGGRRGHSPSYGGLRIPSTFPDFESLPVRSGEAIDSAPFDDMHGLAAGVKSHWCLLAEIVEVQPWIRLVLTVRDRTGTTFQLAFNTDGRGEEVIASVRKGHTVAILYAELHFFAFSPPGVRHETPERLKIFPIPLSDLLALNDRVERYTSLENGIGICHGCDQRKAEIKKCAKCAIFSYCNKDCQAAGWKHKGHKADCKLLQDPNMKRLLTLNAEQDFDDFFSFV